MIQLGIAAARCAVLSMAIIALASCAEPRDATHVCALSAKFATAGDPPTKVDLSPWISEGATLLPIEQPDQSLLSGTSVLLHNAEPAHDRLRIQVEFDDPRRSCMLEFWHVVQPREAPRWPLIISGNGRHLIDSAGQARFWVGASPWAIAVVPTREEVSLYLADRARKGVNAILFRMIDRRFSDHTPPWRNRYGHVPFEERMFGRSPDFTRPEPSYWEHVDWVIREAYRHGMTVLAAPAYIGYQLGDQGWADQMIANGADRLEIYGNWLGRRYAHYPNIVWVLGGDWSATSDEKDVAQEVDAVALGIRSADGAHLMTAHARRDRSSVDEYDRPWLDLNAAYAGYSTVHLRVKEAYRRVPVRPVFLIEAHYGNEHAMSDLKIRLQIYQALLGGAFGQFYGNAPQWYFSAERVDHFADVGGLNWIEHLDSHGARFLPVVAQLIRQYPLETLVPDFDHTVLMAGHGIEGPDYAPFMYSPTLAIGYIPDGRSITVSMSNFSRTVRSHWRSPVNGREVGMAEIPNRGAFSFTPPTDEDWILVLDAR